MYQLNVFTANTKQTFKFASEAEALEKMQSVKGTLGYYGSAHLFKGAELVKTIYAY